MESKVEDLSLPNAVVQRIIKEAVPPGTIVAKDARLAISRVRLEIFLGFFCYFYMIFLGDITFCFIHRAGSHGVRDKKQAENCERIRPY